MASIALFGCAGSTTSATVNTSLATATSAPQLPVHTLTVPNFNVDSLEAGAHGLIIYGQPTSPSQPNALEGGNALYYFDLASQAIRQIAVATTDSGKVDAKLAGDWLVYEVWSDFQWQIWAMNTLTWQQHLVDSSALEQLAEPGGVAFASDGKSVFVLAPALRQGVKSEISQLYNIATGSAQTLKVTPLPSTPLPDSAAMALGTVLLIQRPSFQGPPSPDIGVYLWTMQGATSLKVADSTPSYADLNPHYAVWDSTSSRTLTLYDRATRHLVNPWKQSCIRPAIAQDRPYVMCLDYLHNTAHLVQVPTGKDIVLGSATSHTEGSIAADRAYWVPVTGNAPNRTSTTIDYVDIPAD